MKNISMALLMALTLHNVAQPTTTPARLHIITNEDDNSTIVHITNQDKKTAKAVGFGAGAGFFTGVIIADAVKQGSVPKALFGLAFATSLNIVGKNVVTESLGAEYVKTAGISEAATALLTWLALSAQ